MLYKRDPDTYKSYLEDSSNLSGGFTDEVVIPENIDELSGFIKVANSAKLPVTVSGGGTGTTGSRIPFGGAVVSLEKFNKILSVSSKAMTATVQSGVMVDELRRVTGREGLFYTSHPTEGTAFVGGTVATNASGARSFKYGSTRNYVTRLKMVMADGRIVDLSRGQHKVSRKSPLISLPGGAELTIPWPGYTMPYVKSSSGYFISDGMDLIDLFIGQEGTLSVITEVEMALVARPFKILSALVFFSDDSGAWSFASDARDISKANRARQYIPGIDALSIEYFDKNSLALLVTKGIGVPINALSAIFFEQDIDNAWSEDDIHAKWMDLASKHGALIDSTWIAMNERDASRLTKFRHTIPEAINEIIKRNGFKKCSTDIAVPDAHSIEMLKFYVKAFSDVRIDHVIFGHIGENHLHVNILPKSEHELAVAEDLAQKFVRRGVSLGGSASAEHGIGKIKHKYLVEMYGTKGVADMSKIKKALDPNCILGLDNIFPREMLCGA